MDKPNPTAKTVPDLPPSPDSQASRVSNTKKFPLRPQVLIALVVLIVISGGVGVSIYLNHVNQDAAATAQHNAYLSALSGNGTLVFTDPLNQEHGSQWLTSSDGETTCRFEGGTYHIKPQGEYFKECNTSGTFSNFAFEVEMTITQGTQESCGGIVFRDDEKGEFYYFAIYQDGKYDISRYADYGMFDHLLPYGHSSAIHTGLGQLNKLAVRATGSTLIFYINEQQVQQLQDRVYTAGNIGFAAFPDIGNEADLSFANARLWTL